VLQLQGSGGAAVSMTAGSGGAVVLMTAGSGGAVVSMTAGSHFSHSLELLWKQLGT